MPKKSYINQLQEIGLSKNEAAVYSALLSLGLTTTGLIIQKTKLHGQLVYQALNQLTARDLVSYIIKRNRKYFQASNPDMLLNNIYKIENLTRSIIPNLKQLQKNRGDELQVKIMYGHEGFINNLQDVIASTARYDKTMRIIGGAAAKDFYRVIGDWYQTYINLLERKKIAKWQISPDNTAAEFKEKFVREKNTILKIMPPAFSNITQTRITPEMATIEIYDVETVIIQIHNKAIAKSYRVYFDFLWKQGKNYNLKNKRSKIKLA